MYCKKKAISPVVATSLILVVAVLSVLGFRNWFDTFSTSVFTSTESESSLSSSFEIDTIVGNNLYLNSIDSNLSVQSIEISGIDCNINEELDKNTSFIWLKNCSETIPKGKHEVIIVTDSGIKNKFIYLDEDLEKYIPTFRSRWNVGIEPAFSGLNNLDLPLHSSGNYDFTVDWGDGIIEHVSSYDRVNKSHNYSSSGIYEVKIKGTLEGFGFNFGGVFGADDLDDCDKLIEIMAWGEISLVNGGGQFKHCENLVGFSALDSPDLSLVTSFQGIFKEASSFVSGVGHWDVSNIQQASYLFSGANSFNEDLNNWDTSNFNSLYSAFSSAHAFDGDLADWNISGVNSLNSMFLYAYNFTGKGLSTWNTSSLTQMEQVFFYAYDFEGNVSGWDVSGVDNMNNLFAGTRNFNVDISNWNTSSATTMFGMFRDTLSFNRNLSLWCVSAIGSKPGLFDDGSGFAGQSDLQPQWGTCP